MLLLGLVGPLGLLGPTGGVTYGADRNWQQRTPQDANKAVEQALEFLQAEVPRWTQVHDCYSCHNNGDAARALYLAKSLKRSIREPALRATTAWLSEPDGWKDNGGATEFHDEQLATLQFASAAIDAVRLGIVPGETLPKASVILARYQDDAGFWTIDRQATVGSPVTYGTLLATVMARRVLSLSGEDFTQQVEQADRWLMAQRPKRVLDAAAGLWGTADARGDDAAELRRYCLELILRGQDRVGGWGPFVRSRSEPFDTAIVLLGLQTASDQDQVAEAMQRGRAYLLESQLPDGSWPETTRPAGSDSYAQRMSTTGWVTYALLKTGPKSAD